VADRARVRAGAGGGDPGKFASGSCSAASSAVRAVAQCAGIELEGRRSAYQDPVPPVRRNSCSRGRIRATYGGETRRTSKIHWQKGRSTVTGHDLTLAIAIATFIWCPLPSDLSHGQATDLGWLSLSGKSSRRCGVLVCQVIRAISARHGAARQPRARPRAWAADWMTSSISFPVSAEPALALFVRSDLANKSPAPVPGAIKCLRV